jgi:serine O-acetyltransferase
MLKQLLYSDLARQADLAGETVSRQGFGSLVRRLLHPRFLPIVLCRASHAATLRRIPALPALLSYLNIVLFGLEVSARCEIGPGIFFPHPSGTVIGAWRIGRNVTIFQGVTLGAKELDMSFDVKLRPEIGNNVVVGAGAKILGRIHIGDNSSVGANAVVLESIAANSIAVGIPARQVAKAREQKGEAATAGA